MNLKDVKLQFKLAVPILLVIALNLGLYFYYTLNEKKRLSYLNLANTTQTTANRLKKNLAKLLWNEDMFIAKTFLESEGKKKEINSIVILDEDRKKSLNWL